MARIELSDGELSRHDFSNFELSVQARGGVLSGSPQAVTGPGGAAFVRLAGAALEYDEAKVSGADLAAVCRAFGLLKRAQ